MQRGKTRYLFSFVSPVKIAGIHSYFASVTGKNCTYSLLFKIKLHFYFTGWELWTFTRDTSGDKHSQFPALQAPATFLFIHEILRREKGCKPAFSNLNFPLKNLFNIHLFVKNWSWAGKTLLIVKLTFPQLQLPESQKFNITDRLLAGHCFAFPSVGLLAPVTCSIFKLW